MTKHSKVTCITDSARNGIAQTIPSEIRECAFCGDTDKEWVTCKVCRDFFCDDDCIAAHLIGPPRCGGEQSYTETQTAPSKPFYWVAAPSLWMGERMAPTGWYQWLDNGLVYLGESILDAPDV